MSMSPIQQVATALPETFAGFRDYHAGETVVVCGCGASLLELERPERFVTIGVNDVGRLFTPDYLLVVNTRAQFAAGRFQHVEQSQARALFTHLDLGVRHPRVVRFRLGRRGGVDFTDRETLNYTRNSPYPALCLAIHMGARRIGLLGVDFTDGHFFGATGSHPLARELSHIDGEYRRLREACERMGVEVVNLSAQSRLTALPKTTLADFAAGARPDRPLNVVSYATTPVAGVPVILAQAIGQATDDLGRCVWARSTYGNGVSFETDVEYQTQPRLARELLEAADVVVVHNGKVGRDHATLIDAKPVVTLAHNYMWNVDPRFAARGDPGLVVGQYQATLPEFAGWTPVPNPVPLWSRSHSPLQPDPRQNEPVTICYLPSGKHERYPPGHRLYWHAKGYRTTMAALDRLAARGDVRLEVARSGQVSHATAMAMKQRAHIVIDECATGSYHRTSLEGLAVGAVVVNGVGLLPGVPEVFRRCAGGAEQIPFVSAGLDNLGEVLEELVGRGSEALLAEGRRNRSWMEANWAFSNQWRRDWLPAIERAMDRAAARSRPARLVPPAVTAPLRPAPAADTRPPDAADVTIVVPFAGPERLPALRATLAALRDQGAADVLVLEHDERPCARAVADAAGARHVFAPTHGFRKARAMNIGAGLAATDLILWCDADLILPPGFVAGAVAEMRARRLDYLVPWTSIRYLDEAASQAVGTGAEDAEPAPTLRTVYSRHGDRGGAGLVRADFIDRFGGVCEEFEGWGGEDAAFYRKAALLARAAVTNRNDQHVLHLFHPAAGALDPAAARASNPRHAHNLSLLQEISAIGSRERFLSRFPPPTHRPAPWPGVKRLACPAGAERVGAAVAGLFGTAIEICAPDAGDATPLPSTPPGVMPPLRELLVFAGGLTQMETDPMAVTAPLAAKDPLPAERSEPLKINLGCGDASIAGHLNVDRVALPNVDQQVDLSGPWPWADGSVEAIRAWDIVEHLPDKIHTMNEIWRVLQPGGTVEIVVPTTDGPGAFQDPTHVSFWHRRSFLYYEAGNPYRERFAVSYGIRAAFRVVRERIDATIDGPKLTIVLAAVKP